LCHRETGVEQGSNREYFDLGAGGQPSAGAINPWSRTLRRAADQEARPAPTPQNSAARLRSSHDDYDQLSGTLAELRFSVDEEACSISPVAKISGMLEKTISLVRARAA
jgi:hypothetical protein